MRLVLDLSHEYLCKLIPLKQSLVLLCVSVAGCGSVVSSPTQALKLSKSEGGTVDLGELWTDEQVPFAFEVTNPNECSVQIRSISSSCGCALVDSKDFTLGPKQSRKITGHLNLLSSSLVDLSQPQTSLELRMSPRCDAPPAVWTLTANVISAIRVSSQNISFEGARSVLRNGQNSEATLKVHVAKPFMLNDILYDPRLIQVDFRSEETTTNSESLSLAIIPKSSVPEGRFDTTLLLRAKHSSDGKRISVPVSIGGSIVSDLFTLPRMLVFHTDSSKQTACSSITIASRNKRRFAVLDDRFNPSNAPRESQHDEPPTRSCITGEVVLDAAVLDDSSGTLDIPIRYANGDATTLTVPWRSR
jgi:hypothetical protein